MFVGGPAVEVGGVADKGDLSCLGRECLTVG